MKRSFWNPFKAVNPCVARAAVVVLLLVGALALTTHAQGFMQNAQERVEALKQGYITREAKLTPEQSRTFWAIYDEYQLNLSRSKRELNSELFEANRNLETMSDAELTRTLDAMAQFQRREAELYTEYYTKLKQELPIRTIARIFKAEREFKLYVLQQLRQGAGARGGAAPGGN